MHRLTILVIALALLPAVALAQQLTAGASRMDITPSPELKASLGGYGARMSRPALGVHDRVWTKALVFHQGAKRFGIVTADILAIPPGFKAAVLAELASDWTFDQFMLLASHSHTSIDLEAINPKNTLGIPQIGIFNEPLYHRLVSQFAAVLRQADAHPAPCRVGTASVDLEGWSHNRRANNTAIQPELTVTRVDGDSSPLAVLVNWTAHPTFMDADDMLFSGDWPGHLQRTLEALIGRGVTVMYYNGAEGDQSPLARPDSGGAWERAERYGSELAIVAMPVWNRIKPNSDSRLAFHVEPIALPERTVSPDFMRTGGAEYGANESTVHEIVERLVPTASHSISVRLGDLVIAGVPGELAAVLGDEVKQRVRAQLGLRHVVIGGLADEWISYMLTPGEYRRGGYEASMSFYGPELGQLVSDAVARGASQLR